MDTKCRANDTLRSQVRKHRVIPKFKENSIQNHSDSIGLKFVTSRVTHFFSSYDLQNDKKYTE